MNQLKRLRTEKGLSQAKLAALADVDPSTVNQIERGAREASPATLRKLADALHVSIAELLEDASPKVPLPRSLYNGVEDERRARLDEWLKEHSAQRAILSDEEILQNFERLASGSDRAAIPDRLEQEASETIREEAQILEYLQREWARGGELIPKSGDSSPARRMREKSRLGQKIRFLYRRYLTTLDRFGEALFLEGRVDDFVMVVSRPQIAEARKAALQALREDAFRNAQGA